MGSIILANNQQNYKPRCETSQQAVSASLHADSLASVRPVVCSPEQSSVVFPLYAVSDDTPEPVWCVLPGEKEQRVITLELCYSTARGAGVVRNLRDVASTEKALKSLHRRHIEADLYVSGDLDEQGNRRERVGGVDEAPGVTANGRTVQWQWWYEGGLFAGEEVCP